MARNVSSILGTTGLRSWAIAVGLAALVQPSLGCKALNTVLHNLSTKRQAAKQAATQQAQGETFAARIEAFAATPVDEAALASSDLRSTKRLVGEMEDTLRQIQARAPREDVAGLSRQLRGVERRHLARAASLLKDYEVAFALIGPYLPKAQQSDGDSELIAVANKIALARTEARAARFAEHGTYRNGGELIDCIFASAPFGADGRPNASLSYRFSGHVAAHVRCYLPQAIGYYRARPAGHFVVEWTGGNQTLADLETRAARDRHIDFVLDMTRLDERGFVAAKVQVWLDFVALEGSKIEFHDGAARVRPDEVVEKITGGNAFWQRAG